MSTKAIRDLLFHAKLDHADPKHTAAHERILAAEAELEKLEAASVFIATVDEEHTQGGPVPPEVAAEAASAYDLFHQVAVQVAERKRS